MQTVVGDRKGAVLVEFAIAVIAFLVFLFGLLGIMYWGVGSYFVQDAAYEAARQYAVTQDLDAAKNVAMVPLGRWAYPFIDPSSVTVKVQRQGNTVTAEVRARPRVQKFVFFEMTEIVRTSSCVIEYRFRYPQEFAE